MESSCFPSLAIRAAASASAPGKSSKGNCTGTAVSSTDAAALRSSTLSEVAARAGHLFWREQPPGCLQLYLRLHMQINDVQGIAKLLLARRGIFESQVIAM